LFESVAGLHELAEFAVGEAEEELGVAEGGGREGVGGNEGFGGGDSTIEVRGDFQEFDLLERVGGLGVGGGGNGYR
jgi:hypothetical protein